MPATALTLEQGTANCSPKSNPQVPGFDKPSFTGAQPYIHAELSSYSKDLMACKAQSIYYLALYRKHLLFPSLGKEKSTHSAGQLAVDTLKIYLGNCQKDT